MPRAGPQLTNTRLAPLGVFVNEGLWTQAGSALAVRLGLSLRRTDLPERGPRDAHVRRIELGKLLKEASEEGRTPESDATVAKLMDEYAAIAEWDVSTRQTNEGFIRRTIKPALGPMPH
jgi:hypothetical protein